MDILKILIEWLFVTSLAVQERETLIKVPQTVKREEELRVRNIQWNRRQTWLTGNFLIFW